MVNEPSLPGWAALLVVIMYGLAKLYGEYRAGKLGHASERKANAETSKADAEQDATAAAAWRDLVQPLRDEVAALRLELAAVKRDLDRAQHENARHLAGISLLIGQVLKHGDVPLYMPRPYEPE